MKKRLLSILLTCCMALALLPTLAFAVDGGKAIQPGTSVRSTLKVDQSKLSFAGHEWWVISKKNGGSNDALIITLLAVNNDFGTVAFRTGANRPFENASRYSEDNYYYANNPEGMAAWAKPNEYAGSTLQQKMVSLAEEIPEKEQAIIRPKDITNGITGQEVKAQKLYALSHDEAYMNGNMVCRYPAQWWTRSSNDVYGYVSWMVEPEGRSQLAFNVQYDTIAVRPALDLDLSSVLLISAAAGGKTGDGLTQVPEYSGDNWKLTLQDSERSGFTAKTIAAAGSVLTVKYANAVTGDNEYISAVVQSADGSISHYGRIAQLDGTVNGASGTAEIDLSGIDMTDKTLCVFNEQYNGDNKTDFASALCSVSLTAAPLPAFPTEDLTDPMIRIVLGPVDDGYYAIENGENCTRTAADFFQPGRAPEGAKITAVTPPVSPSISVNVNVDSDGTLNCAKNEDATEIAFKSETYTVTITSDDYAPISAPLTARQYLNAGFQGPIYFEDWFYGDTYTYTCFVNHPGENGVWSALIRNPEIFEIYEETTGTTSEPGKSIYTVQIRAIKAGRTCIDFLYLSDTTAASSKDTNEDTTGGWVYRRPLTAAAGSTAITKGEALPANLVTFDNFAQGDTKNTVLDNADGYILKRADGTEISADEARSTPGTYTVLPAAALKSGWEDKYELKISSGTLTVSEPVPMPVPTAAFTATGADTGTLSGLESGGEYTVSGAANTTFTADGTTHDLTGVSAGTLFLVRKADGSSTIDSEAQTIPVTKAETPTATKKDCTTERNNNGMLQDVTDAMEYQKSGDSAWTDCGGTKVTGLTDDTYYVRVKAAGSMLASDPQTLVIGAYSGGDYDDRCYTIEVTAGAGGSVSPSGSVSVREGQDKTFTITPDQGYAVSSVRIDGKDMGALKSYTFRDVRNSHTIQVTFTALRGFTDVPAGSYYEEAVAWAAENGITTGAAANRFSPEGICTRAQAVTFLWRAAGSPEPTSRIMPFTDVPADSYYYDAVLWAVENDIAKGTGDTTFRPEADCSRAQIVTFLYRFAKSPAAGAVNPFTDVKPAAYYTDAVLWAVEQGIAKGTGDTTFSPEANCTRAQIVTFLWRCMK